MLDLCDEDIKHFTNAGWNLGTVERPASLGISYA
jgi:hypothetical protein